MKVSEEILKRCGLKKSKRKDGTKTWVKKATNYLADTIIFEYNPVDNIARVIVQEPCVTHVDGIITVKDEPDFLEFSWEFYVKYIANNDYHHFQWDAMARVHNKPTVQEIEDKIKRDKENRQNLVSKYKDWFNNIENFEQFADEAYIIRKQIIDNDEFLNDCLDILFEITKAKVRLNLLKEHLYARSEFNVAVIVYLMKEMKKSKQEIINKYIETYRPSDTTFLDTDTDEEIKAKLNRVSSGYACVPIFLATFPHLVKNYDGTINLTVDEYKYFVQCKHDCGKIDENIYLRGYSYDIKDWLLESYEKLKNKPNLVKIMGVGINHSIYEDFDFWYAGTQIGLFEKLNNE